MSKKTLVRVRLYGPFSASWSDGTQIDLRGAKIRGLLALLVTAPDGHRGRAYLQDMLWARSGPLHGRTSLRGALSALKKCLGDAGDDLLIPTKDEIAINTAAFETVGQPSDGAFLEGIEIAERGFGAWVDEKRLNAQPFALKLADISLKPCVAVVPFVTVQGNPQDSMFGDMLAQEITRSLARSQIIDVISHLSSRNLGPRVLELEQISDRLHCDYVVCGNVRVSGGNFRLDVDLVDVASGKIVWTRDYSASVASVVAADSDIPRQISRAVGQSIIKSAVELATSRPLTTVATHDLVMTGIALMHQQSFASYSKARACLEEAIRRAPRRAELHAWLAKWYALNVSQGWSIDAAKDAETAEAKTLHALDLDPDCSFSVTINAYVNNNLLQRFDNSMAQFEHALDIEPNNAMAHLLKGTLHAFTDDGANAVGHCERARMLSPLDPHTYFYDTLCATAHLANHDYETALRYADRSMKGNRRHVSTFRVLVIALQALGRGEEATQAVEQLMRRRPDMTVGSYLKNHPAAHFNSGREWAALLLAAGVPE